MLRCARAILFALTVFAVPGFADNPELSARMGNDAKAAPLQIGKLDIAIAVVGDTARTTVTAEFHNPSSTAKEGEFVFDLPKHSVVTGYALDINGAMIDGVLVGERQARKTYEAAVRRGIDPGLAEVTRTGAFKTHVFPIFPGRGRTIRMTFDTPIDRSGAFVLPLKTTQPVGEFHYTITTPDMSVNMQGLEGTSLGIHRDGTGAKAEGSGKAVALSGSITVTPSPALPPVLLTRHANNVVFFEINDAVPASAKAAAAPDRVRLYWDSSLSRRDADLKSEIALIGKYIAAVKPARIDVVFFAEGAPKVRSFTAPKPGEVEAVLAVTDYQGGTSLKSLFAADLPAADICLMFSDGNVTADSWKTARAPCPLFPVASAADANRPLLSLLAKKSGGAFIDLGATSSETALALLQRRTPAVADVRAADGSDVDFAVLPVEGNRIRIVGRLPDDGDLTVKLARSSEPSRRYKIDRTAIRSADTLGSLWAQRHIDDMLAGEYPDRDAVVEFSRRWSVASTGVSFVVFENLSDYIDAGVAPPAALGKDMLARYEAAKAYADKQKAEAQTARLAAVVRLWNEEKKWWVTPVKPAKKEKLPPPPVNTITTQSRVPAPPPPPAPMIAPSDTAQAETVMVTGVQAEDIGRLPDAAPAEALHRAPGVPGASDKAIAVKIAEWNPDRPYIKALNAAAPETYWNVYREQEKTLGTTPAFYLDVAEFFARHGRKADAIRIVLNALELPSADTTTMTIVADRLLRYGDAARAAWLDERLLFLEGDRPQPRRNLALALAAKADGETGLAAKIADLKRAVALYREIIDRDWGGNFNGIEVISLMEANRLIAKLKALDAGPVAFDKRLIALLDVYLRVVMEWNTDATDMDLWVDEPTGERCMYSQRATQIGGRLSNDMTHGYGPEEYLLRKAPNGTYTVQVNVFANDRLNPNGATAIRAHIFRNWGRADEQEQTLEIELGRAEKDAHLIGTVKVTGSAIKLPATGK